MKNKIFLNFFFILLTISFWPSINFASININENLISPDIFSISLIIFFAAIIFYFFLNFFLNKKISLIFASVTIITFFLFGGYENLYIEISDSIENSAKIALILCFLSFVSLSYLLWFFSNKFSFFLAIYSFIVFLYAPSIIRLAYNLSQESLVQNNEEVENINSNKDIFFLNDHNVYFIILDQYARTDILKDVLGIDNSNFLLELEKRGFLISKNSHSNYNRTGLTLSTSFNMNYYTEVNTYNNYLITSNSKTHEIFKLNSYSFVFVESGGNSEISCSGKEDYCIKSGNFSDDVALFLKMTPLWRIMRTQTFGIYRYFESLYVLTDIDHAVKQAIKKFRNQDTNYLLFAHILSPHEPQRFNLDCSKYLVMNPGLGDDSIDQYKIDLPCLNKQVINAIDYILENDESDPIILIQSDHGISHEMKGVNNDNKLIRLKNLMTFKLPKKCRKYYYDKISPVNNMHLVFSCLTEKKPRYIEDKFFYTNKNKFELEEVTGYLN